MFIPVVLLIKICKFKMLTIFRLNKHDYNQRYNINLVILHFQEFFMVICSLVCVYVPVFYL